jgi:hypothetical protein
MIRFTDALFAITLNYNQSQQLTIDDCLRLAPFWLDCDWLLFYCDCLAPDLRVTHFWFTKQLRMSYDDSLTNELSNQARIRLL